MSDTQKPLLEISNLIKTYASDDSLLGSLFGNGERRIPALNGVSFNLQAGEIMGLTGESGSGKSALARIIAGQERPDSGKVLFDGKNVAGMSEGELASLRRQLRYISEDTFAGLTADPKNRVDRLLYALLDRYASSEGRGNHKNLVVEMLNRVGLGEQYLTRFPHQLSGGQKQRLAIARALLLRPRLIVGDELVSNLDANARIEMLNMLKRVSREQGIAFIFISHNPSMVRYFVGNGPLSVMFAGRIMETLPAYNLFDRATHPYTQTLLQVNDLPSPLPVAALDPALAFSEQERVEANTLPLATLETATNAEGIAIQAQLAANKPGCPFYRWCPEHITLCREQTPALAPVTKNQAGEHFTLDPAYKAACLLRYENQ